MFPIQPTTTISKTKINLPIPFQNLAPHSNPMTP
jgi:hypothetical protein